ncbi:hypothetical protein P691DRAFT_792554 [Macrolepiota fuliginosa MF-IS2]|uniref:2'-phosphotransferase n=1 Tax=Macrolepiota fuliginosa MF-IS2 TaxID=1400762 RepID=A0A9P6C9T1_9AGAR|nr:hypothetical protein P691DRAFT_792554 [Macrolepiota fuliginosa MF-IS2]
MVIRIFNAKVLSLRLLRISEIPSLGNKSTRNKTPKNKEDRVKNQDQESAQVKMEVVPQTNAPRGSQKLRGSGKDKPHGAASEGLAMRAGGYVKVDDLFQNGRLQPLGLTTEQLKGTVSADSKQRYTLVCEQVDGTALAYIAVEGKGEGEGVQLIKANQGHSLKDIPSGLAVHGTTDGAWVVIQKEGLSRMKRNHIHFAQDVGGDNVISGMRKSSQILIFIHVRKALDAGIKFYLSDNGIVLTEGDKAGYLKTEFFDRVEIAKTRIAVDGWEGGKEMDNLAVAT